MRYTGVTMETKPPKIPEFPSALTVESVDDWAASFDLESVQRIRHRISSIVRLWIGVPTMERLHEIWLSVPELRDCLDINVVETRVDELPEFSKVQRILGISLTDFIPELRDIYSAFVSAAIASPATALERAESWLRPIAEDSFADSGIEAGVYFRSRGKHADAPAPEDLYGTWRRLIMHEVQRLQPVGHEEAAKRAAENDLTLAEAAMVLRHYMLRFFSFSDAESDIIDAAFLRAVQWFGIEGLDEWVEEAVNTLADFSEASHEPHVFWALFFALRADLVIEKAERSALEFSLWKLTQGSFQERRPWILPTFWVRQEGSSDPIESILIAATLVFAWYRIRPVSGKEEVVEAAIGCLTNSQLRNGAWPRLGGETEADLLATAAAVHALALAQPEGWRARTAAAATWIEEEQDELGYWDISGTNGNAYGSGPRLNQPRKGRECGDVSSCQNRRARSSRCPERRAFLRCHWGTVARPPASVDQVHRDERFRGSDFGAHSRCDGDRTQSGPREDAPSLPEAQDCKNSSRQRDLLLRSVRYPWCGRRPVYYGHN